MGYTLLKFGNLTLLGYCDYLVGVCLTFIDPVIVESYTIPTQTTFGQKGLQSVRIFTRWPARDLRYYQGAESILVSSFPFNSKEEIILAYKKYIQENPLKEEGVLNNQKSH